MGETYEVYPGSPKFAKGLVADFEDVPEKEIPNCMRGNRYKDIESLIIQWSNDGTKTAGTLARRICLYLDEDWLKFQKQFYGDI